MQRSLPRQIRVLTDGHAGNVRQARALADALRLPTRDTALVAGVPWRWLAPRRLPGAEAAFGPEMQGWFADPALASTLAIGCGRQSALATRLARAHGAAAVQILDPRIDARHWDAVVVPEHDRLRGGNVLTLLGSLNPVGDGWLGAARAAFADLGRLPQPRTALLVGGPTANFTLALRDFERALQSVRHAIARDGGSVLATTSRRTPPAFVDALRRGLDGLPGPVWTGSVDGRNPYAALLGWADRVVCTADSVNMLSEASATRVPVHALGIERARGRPGRFVQALRERGRIRPLDDALAPFEAAPLRETTRIASELRARLGLASAPG